MYKRKSNPSSGKIERSDREILEEILELTRRQYSKPTRKTFRRFEDMSEDDIGIVKTCIFSYMKQNKFRLKEYTELDEDVVFEELRKDKEIRDVTGRP